MRGTEAEFLAKASQQDHDSRRTDDDDSGESRGEQSFAGNPHN